MADEDSESGGGIALNWNTILTLLVVLGSVFLVSKTLTSHREQIPAMGLNQPTGEQTLESRLWEDPFSVASDKDTHGQDAENDGYAPLLAQIDTRLHADKRLLVLPVMVSSGSYGEDQESRIRSRFAIVSGLTSAGYAPSDAEHLGALKIPWPSEAELNGWKRTNNVFSVVAASNGCERTAAYCSTDPTLCLFADAKCPPDGAIVTANHMHLRYEWYRRRSYQRFQTWPSNGPTNVLVMWLDDACFEHEPLLRLPLLLKPIIDVIKHVGLDSARAPVALIGPRRSSTLRS